MRNILYRVLGGLKYLLGLSIILGGISTATGPVSPMDGALGFIYSSRTTMVILGVIFITFGIALIVAKLYKSIRWTGWSLMAVYCSYMFGAIIQFIATGGDLNAWLVNFIMALLAGMLYIYWLHKNRVPLALQKYRKKAKKHDRKHLQS